MKRNIPVKTLFVLLLCLSFVPNAPAQTQGWGYSMGRLGFDSSVSSIPTPQLVPALPDATSIDGYEEATYFLRANGTVASSGSNNYGVLGTGSDSFPVGLPATVINLTDVVKIAGGEYFGMALKSDGTVWCWGGNWYGQLGVFDLYLPDGSQRSNTPLQSLISDVVDISAGQRHALALRSNGTVWAWGSSEGGQAGNEWAQTPGVPRRVGKRVSQFRNLIAVSAGKDFSFALKDDGTVWVWGYNKGIYGDGTLTDDYNTRANPRQVPGLDDVVQIEAGEDHVLALKRDGTVWAWGISPEATGRGQLNDYRFSWKRTSRLTAALIPTQININEVVQIESGFFHSMARRRDGSVWAWGGINFGELGIGYTAFNSLYRAIPYPVQSLTGTGNAFIGTALRSGFAGKPVIQTPVGFGVKHYGENVRMLFLNVMSAGTTSYTALDPATVDLNIPAGYTVQLNEPAYNIATTAQTSGDIEVCIKVNEYNRVEFPMLKILHAEGPNWVDRTFSYDYIRRQVCARVDSLGTFVVAKAGTGFGKE